ncbi:MAG: 3-deoxy-D-manno-octulosonic acid transferase [Phycisphaerae bacterium]|nr:3-deoxy-D-manno-octulosonic acid transferase [Phycisphaerae bacterium]
MKYFLNVVYIIALIIISPLILYRIIAHNRYKKGLQNRLGKINNENKDKKSIWIHAVSVGEVNAAKTIIGELEKKFPNLQIALSTTTDTGFDTATKFFGEKHNIFYFPFDFSWTMARAFKNLSPAICLLMELEVWPNFVQTAAETNVPVVVLNGRISDKSFSRYKLIKAITKKIFSKISLILCQTEEYASRFVKIGADKDKVIVTGSLKYDTAQISDKIDEADQLAAQLRIEGENLIVAGGTGNDEEAIILDAYRNVIGKPQCRNYRLVIVPRKPERFNEVAGIIKQRGFAFLRYSEVKKKNNAPITDKQTIILGDTMGDLRKFYSLAKIIFVGRSLVPMGGSDMMEAAALGKCTIFGPHTFNFRQPVNALLEGSGAIMVKDREQLQQIFKKCILEPEFAQQIAKNGQQIIKDNQGATAKTLEQIEKLLN